MSAPDEIIHQTLRLKIMAALRNEPDHAPLEFKRLKAITSASDGNLGRQITVLAEAGYVAVTKDYHKNRPRTRVQISAKGEKAFDAHVAYLKSLLGA